VDDMPVTTEPRMDSWALMRLAMTTLAQRAYRWAVLAGSFTLFAAAVYRPEPWRILAASLFTLMVLVPLAYRDRQR
jgi:hypothetical protein